jgi:hypothetical protein
MQNIFLENARLLNGSVIGGLQKRLLLNPCSTIVQSVARFLAEFEKPGVSNF